MKTLINVLLNLSLTALAVVLVWLGVIGIQDGEIFRGVLLVLGGTALYVLVVHDSMLRVNGFLKDK